MAFPTTTRTGARPAAGARAPGGGEPRRIVHRLSALFALDSFGAGFTVQAFVAYWLAARFDGPTVLPGGPEMNVRMKVANIVAASLDDVHIWHHVPEMSNTGRGELYRAFPHYHQHWPQ